MADQRNQKAAPSGEEKCPPPATQPEAGEALPRRREGDAAGREKEARIRADLDAWAVNAVERSLMGSLRLKLVELEGLIEQMRRSRGRK